jgi:DNA-binding SARP family transcriptional activator
LLPGWYDNWVVLQRERLRQLRMYASEALADELARVGRNGEAVIRWSRTTAVTGT